MAQQPRRRQLAGLAGTSLAGAVPLDRKPEQPQPPQPLQAQPARTEFPEFGVSIELIEGGRVLVFQTPAPRQTLMFPFDEEKALAVGTALAAPRPEADGEQPAD